jgi:uncharacterized membrane protein YGL010W
MIEVSVNTNAFALTAADKYEKRLAYYQSQHRTVGCKITHMIGVPVIALSVPMLVIKPKLAMKMHVVGWILQFIGHDVYEHNKPVLLETKDPLIILAALQFCKDEWMRALQGRQL